MSILYVNVLEYYYLSMTSSRIGGVTVAVAARMGTPGGIKARIS